MDLKGKVAIVTGGASGIGTEIVKELLEKGIQNVAILDINVVSGKSLIDELNDKYGKGRVVFIITNVTNLSNFEDAFKLTKETFGRLDIVVNNAGGYNEANYKLMIDLNVTGVVIGTKLGFKYMSKKSTGHGGVILNLCSVVGLDDCYPTPVYSATKFAVAGLVRSYGHPYHYEESGVTVVGICPGYTMDTLFAKSEDSFDESTRNEAISYAANMEMQKPEVVGRAAVYIIRNGKPGSLWIIEGGKLYTTKIPNRHTMKEQVEF